MKRILALYKLSVYTIVCGSIVFHSCSDPTLIGSDLLDDIKADVEFTDTVSMVSATITGDSLPTFSPYNPFSFTSPFTGQVRNYLFGNFADPLMGTSSASIYLQPRLRSLNEDFTGATLDSIVLILPYDSTGIYGYGDSLIVNETFGVDVLRVIEDIPNNESLFSNASFATDPTPLGTHEFVPDLSVRRFVSASGDSIDIRYLSIPLVSEFGEELLGKDSTAFASNDALFEFLKGIHIVPSRSTSGVLSFLLRPDLSIHGGIYLYYQQDGESKVFHLRSANDSARNTFLQTNNSGALVEDFLDGSEISRDTNFIQGMGGVRTQIKFPYISALENVLVNKAELELSVAELENDNLSQYPPIDQLIVFQRNTDNTLSPVIDLVIVTQTQREIQDSFGGNLSTTENVYRVNITAALQEMIDGSLNNELVVAPLSSAERANRTVLYGANHPSFPMTLRLTFTKK